MILTLCTLLYSCETTLTQIVTDLNLILIVLHTSRTGHIKIGQATAKVVEGWKLWRHKIWAIQKLTVVELLVGFCRSVPISRKMLQFGTLCQTWNISRAIHGSYFTGDHFTRGSTAKAGYLRVLLKVGDDLHCSSPQTRSLVTYLFPPQLELTQKSYII